MQVIKVIGTNGCGQCMMTKTILTNKNIEFDYVLLNDMSTEDQDYYLNLANEKGITTFPLIIKDNVAVTLQEVI